ncbi:MAG: flagellar cap protein FliD N-terminal domain-containing protein [Pseudomonadota bacterium]
MDSVNDKKLTQPFPFEPLRRLKNTIAFDIDKSSEYSAQSYDNRGRISDVAATLQSKLGYFQTRLSSSSFLSNGFSWQVNTAISSDPDSLLAKAASSALEKTYSIKIDALATARTVSSDKMVSDQPSNFQTGTYSYTLTVDSQSYAIDFDIDNEADDPVSNRTILRGVERTINNLGAGVTARMVDTQTRDYNPYRENTYKDISYLIISSDDTGNEIDFSLADTSGSLIQDLNLDRVSRFGAENQYRMNGSPQGSDSNDVTIESDKVGAYLLGVTQSDETIQVAVKQGRSSLSTELIQIIDDYNDLIRWIDDNDSVISPSLKKTLFKDLSSIATQNKAITLESIELTDPVIRVNTGFKTDLNLENTNSIDADLLEIGLTLNTDGTIDIGEDFSNLVNARLMDVYEALAGDAGFFTKISDRIDTIHGKSENNYVFAFNHILSYTPQGTNRQSIYKSGSASIISLFA